MSPLQDARHRQGSAAIPTNDNFRREQPRSGRRPINLPFRWNMPPPAPLGPDASAHPSARRCNATHQVPVRSRRESVAALEPPSGSRRRQRAGISIRRSWFGSRGGRRAPRHCSTLDAMNRRRSLYHPLTRTLQKGQSGRRREWAAAAGIPGGTEAQRPTQANHCRLRSADALDLLEVAAFLPVGNGVAEGFLFQPSVVGVEFHHGIA